MCAIYSNNFMAPYQGLGTRVPSSANNSIKPRAKFPLKAIAIIAGVLIVGGAAWFFIANRGLPDGLTAAPSGEAIKTLPKELIFEVNAAIEKSYAFNYAHEGTIQSVVQYTSQGQMGENVVRIRNNLTAQGWSIMQDANDKARNTFFYATRANYAEEVNITLEEVGGQVSITVAYAKKNN